MKKVTTVLLALLLVVAMTLSLVACDAEECADGQHSYAEEVIRPATCQTEGAKIQRCKKCGATTAEEVIPKLDHVWDEGVVTKQPTCAEEGVKTFTCTTCDPEVAEPATKTENISVTSNHKYGNLIDEKAASCIQPGTMAHFECADCRKLFVDIDGGGKKEVQASELVIPATGHSYALATDAWSWSDDNLTATLHLVCGNCDDQTENHAFTIDFGSEVSDVEGSCTTPSTVTYTVTVTKEAIQAKLGENDKFEIAADDETKLTASKTVEGVVAGHDYQATFVWEETYSGSGLPAVTVTLKCSRNDSTVTEDLSPVVVEEADSRKPATCGQDGSVTFTVSVEYEQKTYTGEEKTYTLPATGEHNYEGRPYVSDGEAGHHQVCSVCHQDGEKVAHILDKYTPVEGKQQHTVGCSVCDYVQEQPEDCEIEDNTCTKCHAEYTAEQKDTVTVHFHLIAGWNEANLKLYAYTNPVSLAETALLGEFPGKTGWTKDETNDGWYTFTFEIEKGHVGVDLWLIPNDMVEKEGNQTGNIKVTVAEIWIAAIPNTDKVFDSKEAAEAAEEVPDTEYNFYYYNPDWPSTKALYIYTFSPELFGNYTNSTMTPVQDDAGWFKFTYKAKNMVSTIGIIFHADPEQELKDEYRDVALPAQTDFYFIHGTAKAFASKDDALAAIGKEDPDTDWYLVGTLKGEDSWFTSDDNKGNAAKLTAGGYGNLEVKFEFLANDEFKVRKGDTWLGWVEGMKIEFAGDIATENKTGLFVEAEKDQNIKVTKACTVYVKLNYEQTAIELYVESVTVAQHEHVKAEQITVVTAAQCETVGAGYYKCTKCNKRLNAEGKEIGDAETIEIPALGHQKDEQKHHDRVAPTCHDKGTEEYWECANGCGKKLDATAQPIENADIEIDESAHKYTDLIPQQDPNCGSKGMQAHYECQNGCGKYFVDEDGSKVEKPLSDLEIPANGKHTANEETKVEAKAPTCGEDGVLEHYTCQNCDKTVDKDGNEMSTTVDPATGKHTYDNQPYVSDGEAGHHQVCSVCHQDGEKVAHTLDKYTPVEGKQQHTVGCSVCDYVQEQPEDCTVEDNKCTKCDAEYTPVTQEEGKFVVVGKGSFSAGEWTEEAKNRFTHYIDGEENTYNNSITLNFKAGDVFKIKLWDKDWSDTDDFAYGCDVWFDGGKVEGLPSKDGWDNLILLVQGEENGNIKVTVDCSLTLTIYDNNAHKLNITVNSVSGELPQPTPSDGGYWLVGQFNNVSSWGDGLGSAKKFNYDEATSTYSLTVSLKAGDQWKIKADGDKDWKDQVKGTTPREVNFNTADKPTDLFVGSDNINVNYDCTITITFKTTASIVVTVSDITVTATEFTYTFYLYAPNWSKPYIYIWECVIQTTGAPDNWPGDPMTPVSGKTGWYTYSKTSKVNFEGKVQNVIMSDNGSNDVRLGFEVKNGVGKQVTLSNSPMYFNADKGLNQYKSAEEAGVSTSPISNVTPLQVAALPTQGIAKRRLAA